MSNALKSLRNPAYTGANRCIPCTIVNLLIAGGITVAIATVSVPFAAAAFGASIAMIYLRGYLVPGTPELTKQYLPESILRIFDKHPAATEDEVVEDSADSGTTLKSLERIRYFNENKVEPEQFLRDVGAIEECDDVDDVCLTAEFQALIREERADLADEVDMETIASLFDADVADVEDEERDYPAYQVEVTIRKWPSKAALLADVAADAAMHRLTDRWAAVPLRQRIKMREMFRYFQDECLVCGGEIVFSEDYVESCCGKWEVVAIKCADCGEHFVEIDPQSVTQVEDHQLTA